MKQPIRKLVSKMRESYLSFWVVMILLFSAIYLLWAAITRGDSLYRIFFREAGDAFMDFFNSIRDASHGALSYTERKVIYPPMANLIFLLLSRLTPEAYNNASFDDRYTWVDHPACVALIIGFIAVSLLLVGLLFYMTFRGKRSRLLLAVLAALSVPVVSMLERGNIMVLAFLSLMVFAVTYDSERAWVRELGLVALAFSFSIKLYPILFAWILFANKRYGAFFRCALYSLVFLILPTFFFGGPICLWWILQNILSFSGGAGAGSMVGFMSNLTHTPTLIWTALLYLPFLCSTLSFLAAPYLFKEKWKVWTLGCTMFVSYPALASSYAWSVFLIPLVYLLKEGEDKQWTAKKGWRSYLAWMTVPFLPFTISLAIIPILKKTWETSGPVISFNNAIVYVAIIALAAIGTVQTVRQLVSVVKERREGCVREAS